MRKVCLRHPVYFAATVSVVLLLTYGIRCEALAIDKSLNDVAVLLLPPFFVHFFLLFPERHPVLRRRSFLRWLYLPTAVAVAIALYFNARLLPAGAAPGRPGSVSESMLAG